MMDLHYVNIGTLVAICAVAALGVVVDDFKDSLTERLGLSAMSLASATMVYQELHVMDTVRPAMALHAGFVLFAIGHAIKAYKEHKSERI